MIIKINSDKANERYIKVGSKIEKWYIHKEEDDIVWLQKVKVFNPDLPILKMPKSLVFEKIWQAE